MLKIKSFMFAVLLTISTGCEAQDTYKPLMVEAVLEGTNGQQIPLNLEVMQNLTDRTKGMMFRKNLEEGFGMLFVWPEAKERVFWMRNTYISLDMVFVHGEQIVGLVENATPLTDTPRAPKPNKAANKVIELPGGYIAKHHITTAWKLKLKDASKLNPLADSAQ